MAETQGTRTDVCRACEGGERLFEPRERRRARQVWPWKNAATVRRCSLWTVRWSDEPASLHCIRHSYYHPDSIVLTIVRAPPLRAHLRWWPPVGCFRSVPHGRPEMGRFMPLARRTCRPGRALKGRDYVALYLIFWVRDRDTFAHFLKLHLMY